MKVFIVKKKTTLYLKKDFYLNYTFETPTEYYEKFTSIYITYKQTYNEFSNLTLYDEYCKDPFKLYSFYKITEELYKYRQYIHEIILIHNEEKIGQYFEITNKSDINYKTNEVLVKNEEIKYSRPITKPFIDEYEYYDVTYRLFPFAGRDKFSKKVKNYYGYFIEFKTIVVKDINRPYSLMLLDYAAKIIQKVCGDDFTTIHIEHYRNRYNENNTFSHIHHYYYMLLSPPYEENTFTTIVHNGYVNRYMEYSMLSFISSTEPIGHQ